MSAGARYAVLLVLLAALAYTVYMMMARIEDVEAVLELHADGLRKLSDKPARAPRAAKKEPRS